MALGTREGLRAPDGSCRRTHVRAVTQRVEVLSTEEIKIMGRRTELLRTLAASGGDQSAILEVRNFKPKWRARNDSTSDPQIRSFDETCYSSIVYILLSVTKCMKYTLELHELQVVQASEPKQHSPSEWAQMATSPGGGFKLS